MKAARIFLAGVILSAIGVVTVLLVIPVIGQPSRMESGQGRMVDVNPDDEVVEACIECHLELHGNPMETAGKGLKAEICTSCHQWMHQQPVNIRTQAVKVTFRHPTGDFEAGKEYEGQMKLKMGEIFMYPERHLRISPGRSLGMKFIKEEGGYFFYTVFLQGGLKIDNVEVIFVPWEFQAGEKKGAITPANIDEIWFRTRGSGRYASIEDYKKTYSQVDSGPAGGGMSPLAFTNYDIPAGFRGRGSRTGTTRAPRPGESAAGAQSRGKAATSRTLPRSPNRAQPLSERKSKPPGQVVFTYNLEKARPYHFVARPDGQVVSAGSNQIALWIEDEDGYYVDTVFVTRLAGRWGYRFNLATLPTWRRASRWDIVSRQEVDAVTGPTQKPGAKTLVWDCRDWQNNPVEPGTYTYRLEANLQMTNLALWTGRIEVGSKAQSSEATLRRIPPDNTAYLIVKDVKAVFKPASSAH